MLPFLTKRCIIIVHLNRIVRKPTMWLPNRSYTKRAVQAQKFVRGWNFWIQKIKEFYYPCSENKGAVQLRIYCAADLRFFVFAYGKCRFSHDAARIFVARSNIEIIEI